MTDEAAETAPASDTEEVLAAARDLVAAFARHDTGAYFDAFAADATFIFHTSDVRIGSRAEYERLWERWETEDGFRVLSCRSSNGRVRMVGRDGAVFGHDVETTVAAQGETSTVFERETIVFERVGPRWLAVHEHLSPAPATGDDR
ncbi:nuclear transport factor 2 family protein [Actinoallomurus sp. NPDC052274]|uniref:nuclear transport factor 2 family protein n=1 Tax=Actinoallomurus sp. NPDC052274 TaxID=3155420 RepID=UPI00342F4CD8